MLRSVTADDCNLRTSNICKNAGKQTSEERKHAKQIPLIETCADAEIVRLDLWRGAMRGALSDGTVLAVVSGIMNGSFTLPMRFLGRWDWEHVWSLFIAVSCLVMPAVILTIEAPNSWAILIQAPSGALTIATVAGFAWGFGAIMFGQSVSAIGISLANTLTLAISSALGSLLPLILLARQRLFEPEGLRILEGVAVAVIGIVFCGYAGRLREKAGGAADRGDLVGKARPLGFALLLAKLCSLARCLWLVYSTLKVRANF